MFNLSRSPPLRPETLIETVDRVCLYKNEALDKIGDRDALFGLRISDAYCMYPKVCSNDSQSVSSILNLFISLSLKIVLCNRVRAGTRTAI